MARQWRFDWRLWVFSGFFLPVLLGLGVWQLNRAAEKADLLAAWQVQGDGQPWVQQNDGELRTGQPVSVTGRYGKQTWLLDNRTREGRAGYEVLTLFQPVEGPAVVINRGWVPAARTRDQLPVIHTPDERVTLDGRLSGYPEPPVLAEPKPATGPWPRRVQALPVEVVAREVERPAAKVIQLSGGGQPGAFRADHSPDVMGPQTHYGYAAQWFALALALTILTVVASYRKTSTGADNDNNDG